MRLRNKKTGEIYDFKITPDYDDVMSGWKIENKDFGVRYYSCLAELNAEWEDYEEPKVFWYIEPNGVIARIDEWDCCTENDIEVMKLIGNYFETREEAEKAVEKLKAWKRLKDKGFKFELWDYDGGNYQERIKTGRILFRVKDYEEVDKYLDLLFGDEK